MTSNQHCEFCEIVAGHLPKKLRHEEDDLLVIHNKLDWAPIMLLIIPKRHLTQEQFWTSALFPRAAELVIQIGSADCPEGYRILANIGEDAIQTQPHGHLHVVGGTALGLYVSGRLTKNTSASWYSAK